MDLKELRRRLPFQWKVQTVFEGQGDKNGQAYCVAYIDARDAQNLLDEVCGPDRWSSKFEGLGAMVFCAIGIKTESNEWVWKSDVGTKGDIEAEKSQASDAFKRAGVQWGIGRFLYDMPIEKVAWKGPKKGGYLVDEKGARIYDLTKYLNDRAGSKTPAQAIAQPKVSKEDKDKAAIVTAMLKLGVICKTKDDYATKAQELTSLELVPANYGEILSRLNTLVQDMQPA